MNDIKENLGACRIYLIRHGETEWALTGQHTGQTDIPLTPNGENQAAELAKYLKQISFDYVFSSPLKRARQTSEFAGFGNVAEIDPNLAEWNYGDYEGKRTAEIREQRPNWDVYQDGCPAGEMPEQITTRADRVIKRVSALQGNIALFSHRQLGGVLAMQWVGLPITSTLHFPLSTASISILAFDSHHPRLKVINLWNFIPESRQVAEQLHFA